MTGFHATVLVVQAAAALGILAFWRNASKWNFDEPWRPPGFAQHEAAFRVPDTLAAALLLVSAALGVAGRAEGRSLGLVAAGMLLFLGVIDFTYMRQQGLFAREKDGAMHAVVVAAVLAVAALLLAAYLPAA